MKNKVGAVLLIGVLAGLASGHAATLPGGRLAPDAEIPPYAAGSVQVSGSMSIVGSTTMQPLLAKLAAGFGRFHQEARIAVEGSGSGEAIRQFLVGFTSQRRGEKARSGHDGSALATILASSRELSPDELTAFRSRHGYDPIAIPIAMDAVTIFVHRDNPLGGLTLDELDAIFGETRKREFPSDIVTWGQLGLKEEWEKQAIHLHGRHKGSGTRDFFTRRVLLDGTVKPEVQEAPGAASEILAIAQDRFAIGYAGMGFQTSFVRVVPVAERAGVPYVQPTADSVTDRSYPLSRALYLYLNQDPKKAPDRLEEEFLKFVNSREGQETVVRAQLYPLTAEQVAANLELLSRGIISASLSR